MTSGEVTGPAVTVGVDQNPYLADGVTIVDAIVTIAVVTIHGAADRVTPELSLTLWNPAGARVTLLTQVAPAVGDLTGHRLDAGQNGEYPLGSWGIEERDYHLRVEMEPASTGREKLAARIGVVSGGRVVAGGLVKAIWTDDTELAARISRRVAHYTGQAELAQLVEDGLVARRRGDTDVAIATLYRAFQLAQGSGNAVAASRLRAVIDIDEPNGTARLRRWPTTADGTPLDHRSTRTVRVRKEE
jgi:hypothetical protein